MILALLLSSILGAPPVRDSWYWASRLTSEKSDATLAARKLQDLGVSAIPALRRALTIRRGHSRTYAASLLRALGSKAAPAARELADCVAAKPSPSEVYALSITEDCAWALVAIGPPAAHVTNRLIEAIEARPELSLHERAAIDSAIEGFGPAALPDLLKAVREGKFFYGPLADLGEVAFPAVVGDLDKEEYREGAVRTLSVMDPKLVAPVLPKLLAILGEECAKRIYHISADEIARLITVIRKIGPEAEASLPTECPAAPYALPTATPTAKGST